ncbi:Extracellular ribonuclease/nuclease fusion protein [uncultured Paludibacter sp.]|nr:Extracellular ribonuclease/nuclease fusion protein [uncultured Paludibacter sp.]
MKKILPLILFIIFCSHVSSQTSRTIPDIQGSGNTSPRNGDFVKTSGIVTAKYIGSNMINGFFLQDASGDGNSNTSDGIFVSTSTDNIVVGDKIQLTATVNEYNGRTQLINPVIINIDSHNNTLPVTKVVFDPANFNWEKYEGMLLEFSQTLFVNNNRNLERYGELELGDVRKPSPTNIAFPASTEYEAQVNRNALTPIYLDDAITTSYYSPIVFADGDGTRRTGERITNLQAVVDYVNSKYVIYPATFPVYFYGNPRPVAPTDLGNYNLKVCGFNLEYYLTQNFGTGLGPDNQTESDRQHTKIIQALKAIDADIYGLVEIEQGQAALTKLANSLISVTGKPYAFINDGGTVNGTYTKVGYLYRSDIVTPYKSLKENNSPSPANRKKLQAFTLKSNNEKFIFSINHFKAKSGCSSATGNDADQGDGQSCYNATRTAEANSVINFINSNKGYYGDDDALVMGDLNAYAKEDPIQAFTNNGYFDMHQKFHPDTAYSYVYNGEAGYLDHALANESMKKQITGVSVFHINSDEPTMFEYSGSKYQPDMYRCSDHDPVVVGISLGVISDVSSLPFDEKVKVYPTYVKEYFTVENAEEGYIQIYSLNGVKLYETQIQSNKETFSKETLQLQSGAYVVRILGEKSMARRMIIVK